MTIDPLFDLTGKIALVTGGSRGLGRAMVLGFAEAGAHVIVVSRKLDACRAVADQVEALGRRALAVAANVGRWEELDGLVDTAYDAFGRVDVLVNNAGNFIAGFFEEISPAQVETQVGTLLFGTMAVTRAVLPTMRGQRAGRIVSISSTAGIVGQQFCSAYAAAKFGVEGWMESLATEVEQFGISTTIVEPGFFRTDLLTPESTTWAELSIDDYAAQSATTKEAWQSMNGKQGGDPAKLAAALVSVVTDKPPARWVAGADAVQAVEDKAKTLLAQVDAYRELSSSLAHDDA